VHTASGSNGGDDSWGFIGSLILIDSCNRQIYMMYDRQFPRDSLCGDFLASRAYGSKHISANLDDLKL
jgi:hypothetical protein